MEVSMKNNTDKKKGIGKRMFFALKIIAAALCTVIGSYGILHAPQSDKEELEQTLKQNERELEQQLAQESVGTADPDTAAVPEAENPQGEQPVPDNPSSVPKAPETLTVIGDSVFLGASPAFKKLQKNAVIDAKVSRQVCQALDVANKLEKQDKLGDTVIISLGINGNFNYATGQALIDFLGTGRTIYWINAFGKEKDIEQEVNKTIRKLAQQNENVSVIPWADEGKKHPDWFYQDGTHLNEKGQDGFARFVKDHLP